MPERLTDDQLVEFEKRLTLLWLPGTSIRETDADMRAILSLLAEVRTLRAERASMRIMWRVEYEIVAEVDGELVYQQTCITPGPLIEALRDHPERYRAGSSVAKVTATWERTDAFINVTPYKEN